MYYSMINKKMVRKNKALRKAGKNAQRRYGRARGYELKTVINKAVQLAGEDVISLVDDEQILASIPVQLSQNDLIYKLREVNLLGLSGSGFPEADKIQQFADTGIRKRYLVINAAECDSGLLHDEWICKHLINKVLNGVNVLAKCFEFSKIVLASKENLSAKGYPVQMVKVPNVYPIGYENQLIKCVLNKELGKDEIPALQGILVLNVQTVLKIGEIICNGATANYRYITVADMDKGEAYVTYVKIGTSICEVIKKVFPYANGIPVHTGFGAFTVKLAQEDEKVSLMTNFIAIGGRPDYEKFVKCKNCGACSKKCPSGVDVKQIVQAMEQGITEGLEQYQPSNCIGCNSCTYFCRAGKNVQAAVAAANSEGD